jgi:hypothetical protein
MLIMEFFSGYPGMLASQLQPSIMDLISCGLAIPPMGGGMNSTTVVFLKTPAIFFPYLTPLEEYP